MGFSGGFHLARQKFLTFTGDEDWQSLAEGSELSLPRPSRSSGVLVLTAAWPSGRFRRLSVRGNLFGFAARRGKSEEDNSQHYELHHGKGIQDAR